MKRVTVSCCTEEKEMGLPDQIQKELAAMGGLEALAGRIPPQAELEEKSRIFHGLSDPIRLKILYLIRDQPLCVCVINRFMRLAGSKLSYHLAILKDAGLIEGEYCGNWIIYSITDTGRSLVSGRAYR